MVSSIFKLWCRLPSVKHHLDQLQHRYPSYDVKQDICLVCAPILFVRRLEVTSVQVKFQPTFETMHVGHPYSMESSKRSLSQ